jgi:hypothetical protein
VFEAVHWFRDRFVVPYTLPQATTAIQSILVDSIWISIWWMQLG